MTGDISKFDKLEEYNGGIVKLGNDVPHPMKGRGSFTLNKKIRCDLSYWGKGIKYNLLSVSQLNNTSHKIEFQNMKIKIYDDDDDDDGNLVGTREQAKRKSILS
jgi:hypothetical protein